MNALRRFLPALLLTALLPVGASAQSSGPDLRKQVADLTQDVAALRGLIGSLRIEVEDLQRQNIRLRERIGALGAADADRNDVMRQVEARLAALKADLLKEDARTKKEIVASVTRQVDSLAAQMRAALEKIAGAAAPRADDAPTEPFTEDYPKDGIMYLVQPGDTLSGIASEQNSRVKWIRDANKIANASRDLRAGETIFVPQSQ